MASDRYYLYQAAHCINSNKHNNVETTARAVAMPRPEPTRHKVQHTAATAKAIVIQPLVALASSGTRAMTMHARRESPIRLPPVSCCSHSYRICRYGVSIADSPGRGDNWIDGPPMKAALVILFVAAVLLLVTVFVRSRHSPHLDVTPDAREEIEKAKRR